MNEFKTPISKRTRSRLDNPELRTPIKVPASPFLEQIGYGYGVGVFTLERSPKVGFTRSPWAIKKRNRLVPEDKTYNERIRIEADILRALNHPNIVGFRGFTETANGEPCLAMEKLDCSLGDLIESRLDEGEDAFPAKQILSISYEIVKGLEYLHHTAHVLHGDMKSYNILISRNLNIVKICDFGVSIPLNEALEMDTSKGKFEYKGTDSWNAPEIILDDGPITNKADVWAFGLIVWEMIALTVPHLDVENCSLSESMSEEEINNTKEKYNTDDNMDDSICILSQTMNPKWGTRPALPAIPLGREYDKVLELFFACTTPDYKVRPSAKGLVQFFKRYVYIQKD